MHVDLRTRWNHNTHHYGVVLGMLMPGYRTALDVGTGDGLLAALLSERLPDVTGIDADPDVLDRARGHGAAVNWVCGDVMAESLPKAHYDLVAAVATVHHLPDLAAALARLAELTAPGGALVVIGCARSSTARDVAMDLTGVLQHQVLSRTRGYWEHSAPVRMDFPHTYAQARRIAAALPGMTWRRRPLFRYTVTWRKPIAGP